MRNKHITIDDKKLKQIIEQHPQKAGRWLSGVATQMVNEIKLSFGTSPPGLTHGNHVASQAGYPPNVDTGTLRASIRWENIGSLRRQIMDGVEYGKLLEDGTEGIEPRPFMQPVFDEWQDKIADDARQHLEIE